MKKSYRKLEKLTLKITQKFKNILENLGESNVLDFTRKFTDIEHAIDENTLPRIPFARSGDGKLNYEMVFKVESNGTIHTITEDCQPRTRTFEYIEGLENKAHLVDSMEELMNHINNVDEYDKNHQKLREILQDYGNEEYGDCIIDEISFLFGHPTTTDLHGED